jgi:hypothetical protein
MPPYPTVLVFIPGMIAAGMALLLGVVTRAVSDYFNREVLW